MSYWDRRRKAAATIAAGVSLAAVCKTFGARAAVSDFSLEIAPGEIVCLLGPSGCGKSTLLRLIAGVERLDAGRIAIGDFEVASPKFFMPPEERGVGLMFQDFALFPHLRVIDNVAFGLKRLGRETARKEALAALARMGLADYADSYPHMLSGGQQQRVALARAIVPRPGVMLMDEPFSGLDSRLRHAVRNETLAILREVGATAIIVTHDAEEAMRIADRVAVMRAGRLVQAGSVEELYQRPADIYVAETFSEMNLVPCRVISGWAVGPLGRFRAPAGFEGEVTLCVRPRAIELCAANSGTPARVLEARPLGSEAHVELCVQGLETSLVVRLQGAAIPAQGAELCIRADAEQVLMFPKQAQQA
ncbi:MULTISPECIES: ABC transporter ATP-binding protein [Rhodomicrobium]|uniref:ABC transporter ATP-binding protein n=1 Tax=Rhodomicrobium TaxID=1068 RepID=UPI000B4BA51D|nr:MULTISPECIES: ABC transporter ATP-binding protein [Rhodomicrobium]